MCPGVSSGTHLQRAEAQRLSRLDRPGRHPLPEQLPLDRMDQDLELRPPLPQRPHLAHVVEVVVGQQHMRRRQPQALRRLHERLHRAARIDEERRAPPAVGDQISIRQELRMHRPLDDHRRSIPLEIHRAILARAALGVVVGLRPADAAPYTPPMALIHTCYRITDIDRSVAFY